MSGLSNYFGGAAARGVSSYFGTAAPVVTQLTWYISPANGNDSNDGASSATAIATFAEFLSRTNGATFSSDVTVWVLDDCAEHVDFAPRIPSGGQLTIRATPTVYATGTLTSGTLAWNNAATQEVVLACSGLSTSFTASDLVGRQIRNTSATRNGSTTWVGADLGSKTARCCGWLAGDLVSFGAGQSGDTFEALSLVKLSGRWSISPIGSGTVWIQDLEMGISGGAHSVEATGICTFARCNINGLNALFGGSIYALNCCVRDGYRAVGLAVMDISLALRPGLSAMAASFGGRFGFYDQNLVQGYGMDMQPSSMVTILGSVSFCDNTRGATLLPNAVVDQSGYCWFRDTTSQVHVIWSGARWVYASGRAPANVGSTSPTLGTIAGAAITALPQVAASSLAGIVVRQ